MPHNGESSPPPPLEERVGERRPFCFALHRGSWGGGLFAHNPIPSHESPPVCGLVVRCPFMPLQPRRMIKKAPGQLELASQMLRQRFHPERLGRVVTPVKQVHPHLFRQGISMMPTFPC